jgi:DNA adenine methylase
MPLLPTVPSREMLEAWYARVRQAKPFLRWAGGKHYFLYQFAERIPPFSGAYIEPFLGSGSVFFKVMGSQSRPAEARLGDTNSQLIQCFLAVRDEPEQINERLQQLQHGYLAATDRSEFYYEQRNIYNATLPKPDPALFIFLNRTCWNGLYRVNLAGRFNVPYGAPKSEIVVPSVDELLNAAAALTQASLRTTTWQNTLAFAEPGDFVFLDPPYYSEIMLEEREKRRSGKYHKRGFDLRDHHEVAESLAQLARRRIDFMLTNSAEPEMVELYRSHNFQVAVIQAPRSINSKTDRRSSISELLVTPPDAPYGIVQTALPGMLAE